MSTLVKVEVVMAAGGFAGFILLAVVGHALQSRGVVPDPAKFGRTMLPFILGLFLVLALGLIGLGLHLFIVGQGGIGNGDVAPVSFLQRHETGATLAVWAFLLLGSAVALPAAWKGMLATLPPAHEQSGDPCEGE